MTLQPSDSLRNANGDQALLFPRKNGKGGYIVAITKTETQLFKYKSEKKMSMAWASYERSIELNNPQVGDICITENSFYSWVQVGEDQPFQHHFATLREVTQDLVSFHKGINEPLPDVWLWQSGMWVLFDAEKYLAN